MVDDTRVATGELAAETPTAPPQTRSYLVPGLIAALVLALALAITFGVLFFLNLDTSADDVEAYMSDEAPEVEKRSTEVVNLLMNYDATNLDRVADRMLDLSTGNFRQQYDEIIGGGLGEALERVSASSRGQIREGPDVSFRTPSEAVAVFNVSQTTQSKENPTGQTIEYILEMTLVDTTDGGWKADRVEILSERRT